MLPSTRQLLLGAVLLTGQRSSSAFHVAPTFSHARLRCRSRAVLRKSPVLHDVQDAAGVRMSSTSTSMQDTIERRLKETLSPVHLEVINESHMHSGPATESHFKVVVVTEEFEGKPLVARHRMVNTLFAEEMTGATPKMHALSIQGKTPSQWEAEGHKVAPSPPCMGGSKADPSMVDSTLSSALRATGRQQEVGGTRWRWGARVHNSLWLNNLRLRGSMGFLVAGFLACSVWMLCPRSAKAAVATAVGSAGKGGKVGVLDFLERYRNLIIDVHYEFERTYGGDVGSRILGEVKPFAKFLDDVFIEFAERFGAVLDRLHSKQLRKQASVMFVAASQTSGVAPVAAAGLIGQPLGRTMVLTILSHTYYAVSKFQFFLFALAIKNFKGVTAKQQRENSSVKPIPKPTRRAPPSLFPKHRRRPVRPAVKPAARSTPMSKDPALIAFRNQTNTMAPKWLIVVAAFCGPSIATVSAAVALDLKLGKVMPILKSFFLGSVLGSLLAGSLCFSGAGTELAARWAVLQAMFGLPFQALLNDNLLFSWLVILYMLSQMRGKSARMQK